MREAWEVRKLGEVCRLLNGRAYKKSELLEDGKYPVLRVGNFFSNRSWYYSDLELEEDKYCDEGDLLYAWSASFGPRIWNGPRVIYHYHIWKCDLNDSEINKRFLLHWFDWDTDRIRSEQGTGTTMIHVSKSSMEKREICLPPLAEQKRIVAVLDEAFAAIERAKEIAQQNLANARELFESYLNRVFTEKGEGWEEKTLEELGSTQTGSTPKKANKSDYGEYIPFVKPSDFLKDGTLNLKNNGLSEEGLANARVIPEGSALMVCIGATIGKSGFSDSRITTNQQINAFIPDDEIDYRFAYYTFVTRDFQRSVIRNSGQATLPIISKSKWSRLSICYPDKEGQLRIINTLDHLRQLQISLEVRINKKLEALDELKQSILQKAFTGQLTGVARDLELAS
ncbi:restriction endonuclease subunit S [Rubinisphaera sp. JC750]|uniref:restriction endonuclease subunit S n=1 Tax=Rubinisphaera sp. JC750 TaxID=2898658 RepID=UPI001EFFB0A5|nr:restriction endonuclease subunit S [Rubinisphaera sp. JC750]